MVVNLKLNVRTARVLCFMVLHIILKNSVLHGFVNSASQRCLLTEQCTALSIPLKNKAISLVHLGDFFKFY